jgi:PAS domain S-box-containing protein
VAFKGQPLQFQKGFEQFGKDFEILAFSPQEGQFSIVFTDITSRMLMESDLRESRDNFIALAENASDGIVLMGGEGKFVYANRRFGDITGYSIAELLTIDVDELVHPAEKEILWDRLARRVKADPMEIHYETKLIAKAGAAVPIEVSGSRTTWRGQPAVLIIIRDITLRKQLEKSVRISERNFRALAENANNGIILATGEGIHIYANERFAQISGYSVAELLKMSVRELTPRYEVEALMKRYQKRLVGKDGPTQYEAHLVRKDGVVIPIEVAASKSTWQGKPAVLEIISDISERKQEEEQQKKARDELERRVEERTSELVEAAAEMERKHQELMHHRSELENVNRELIDTNKALTTLARNIDRESEDAEKKIAKIVRSRALPVLEEFQRNPSFNKYRPEIDELILSLSDLTPGLKDSADIILSLSAMELRIASMIKNGLTSPEIADTLHLSLDTIKTHRRNIRKKLQINNSKINLASYLQIKMG